MQRLKSSRSCIGSINKIEVKYFTKYPNRTVKSQLPLKRVSLEMDRSAVNLVKLSAYPLIEKIWHEMWQHAYMQGGKQSRYAH